MKIHELKTDDHVYRLVENGKKTFDFRKNDRDFKEGDILHLKEWYPGTVTEGEYSGHSLLAKVTYILMGGVYGVPEGYCVMSIKLLKETS